MATRINTGVATGPPANRPSPRTSMKIVASAERRSEHPLAAAIVRGAKERGLDVAKLESFIGRRAKSAPTLRRPQTPDAQKPASAARCAAYGNDGPLDRFRDDDCAVVDQSPTSSPTRAKLRVGSQSKNVILDYDSGHHPFRCVIPHSAISRTSVDS